MEGWSSRTGHPILLQKNEFKAIVCKEIAELPEESSELACALNYHGFERRILKC